MKNRTYIPLLAAFFLLCGCLLLDPAAAQEGPPAGSGFGEPSFGPDGPGPGGMMQPEIKLVKQFDKDGNGWLNAAERKAAREFLQKERAEGRGPRGFGPRGGPGGPGGPGFGASRNQEPPKPGAKLTHADVKSFPNAPLYDAQTLRTFFLEFENADWEKELEDFHGTDVDVPAKLTVDGKTYPDVGVHFRGMSSYGMIGTGRKRSLNLSLDLAHKDQSLGGYRTLNLLNAHEDPTYLRPILFLEIARDYLPASKANLARVAINGENWGIYDNVEQFNKDFVKEWFGTTKGARWKVRGSPGGQGGLKYLDDDSNYYKDIYTIKTKDDPKAWASFIQMCKILNETRPDKLEAALSLLLDIDGALRFIALDNALINNDGYWIRTSDYSIYQDVKGRFHIIPADVNETFVRPGGPGFGGGPGMMLAPQILSQGDKNEDQKLSKAEFSALADAWFDKLDVEKAGKLTQKQFTERFGDLLPARQGFGPAGGGRGFGPGRFVGPGLFTTADGNKDGLLTRAEIKAAFEKWALDWDSDKSGLLTEEKLRTGLAAVLPQPNFGAPGGVGGGRGGGGRPGFGNMPRVEGVNLDPLVAANDPNKPLISKLLAVPSLRERYLRYTKDIAEKWLDWRKLGPITQRYHALIADDVAKDTRKLDSTEDFEKGLTEDIQGSGLGPGGGGSISLKNFADQRRAYLLNYSEAKK
jgi:spore coat protein CotH